MLVNFTMRIQSCFLFFIVMTCVSKVISENNMDIFKLKQVIDEMDDMFVDRPNLEDSFTCVGLKFIDCYQQIHNIYKNDIEPKIIDVIDEQIIKHLEAYNILVLSLFTEQQLNAMDLQTIINAIRFEDSMVYCVIGFLSMFDRNLNNKLTDYIFYSDSQVFNNVKNVQELNTLINNHLKSRKDKLQDKLVTNRSKTDIIQEKLPSIKKTIDLFSTPFCNTKAPWIKADEWMWKKLQNSQLISQYEIDKINLLDWKDIKVPILQINYNIFNL